MSLEERIKAEAYRLGFVLAGITRPDPPPHLAVFERWLEAGRHGEMAYLGTERARERRADPRQILPECRAILVLATPYDPAPDVQADRFEAAPTGGQPGAGSPGKVAAYAWGDDYHDVLPQRMQALVAYLEREVGRAVPNRGYTDTGPILERDLAQRAGLGWIGKNTCLIHPAAGSYFLLSEILLGLDLEPDPAFTGDHCGTCTRCIEACPTQCILPDRTLDAGRCLSYLTIELKGAIPPELRPGLGSWVFGCDVCQQVCPWNIRFAPSQGDPAFAPRENVARPDLLEAVELSPEAFNRRFRKSPVKRAKRRGYLRNVAVALGNQKNPRAVAALEHLLRDEPEPLVRQHAAWALGQIGTGPAREALNRALPGEPEAEVRLEIKQALLGLTPGRASPGGA